MTGQHRAVLAVVLRLAHKVRQAVALEDIVAEYQAGRCVASARSTQGRRCHADESSYLHTLAQFIDLLRSFEIGRPC